MHVDRPTFRDLEIFETEDRVPALFDRLERTVSHGGNEALRRRFLRPFSDAARIRAVQDSVRFLMAQPQLASLRPDQKRLHPLEAYLALQYVTAGPLRGPRALWDYALLRLPFRDVYWTTVHGLRAAVSVLRWLRDYTDVLEGLHPPGELGELVAELARSFGDAQLAPLLEERAESAAGVMAARLDSWARDECRSPLARVLQLCYEIDALVSLGVATAEKRYVLPELTAGDTLELVGVWHPFVPAPVANDFVPSGAERLLFLTGPNMAGKTTYLKACGLAVYLAQIGMGVPAASMRLAPFEVLFTGLRTSDNVALGVSYFQAEARRVSEAARFLARGSRTLVIFDEMFKGTNVKDALDASARVIEAFARARRSMALVSSHLVELAEQLAAFPEIGFHCFDAKLSDGVPRFDYRLRPGVSGQRLGMAVLRHEGVLDLLERMGLDAQPKGQ